MRKSRARALLLTLAVLLATLVAPSATADETGAGASDPAVPPGLSAAGEARSWAPLPSTKLPAGDPGVHRVAVTGDGSRAVLLQSYAANARMVVLDITKSPAKITGVTQVGSDTGSDLELHSRFSYSTDDDTIVTTTFASGKPRVIARTVIGTLGFEDLAITANGEYLYASAYDITGPADRIVVFRVGGNGIPRRVGVVQHFALGRMEISPNGRTLLVIDENHDRLLTYSLANRAKPRLVGSQIPIGTYDPEDLALSRGGRYVYIASNSEATVAKVDLQRRLTVKIRRITDDYGGDIAVAANGDVVTTLSLAQGGETSVLVMNNDLRTVSAFKGVCFPDGVAASYAGPTQGRLYVGDSGICSRATFNPLRPRS